MPTFSVIVPVYGAEHTLERCVQSIVLSGGEDVQIILVEDRSADRSWEVCLGLADRYDTVLCLRNERNRGVSYTRNRGLDAATGKYLLFVDSDDWVETDYVSAFRSAIAEGADFALCGYINHDEKQSGRTDLYDWDDFEGVKEVALQQEIENIYRGCLLQQLWNKVFVTEIVRNNGIRFDESISIGEDTRFILDYIRCAAPEKTILINRPLYHYMRDQAGSLMFRVGYESVEEPLKNLQKLYGIMRLSDEEIEERLRNDRQMQIENYAYLIMHNAGMRFSERRRLILALDTKQGKHLYRKNMVLFAKERAVRFLHAAYKKEHAE